MKCEVVYFIFFIIYLIEINVSKSLYYYVLKKCLWQSKNELTFCASPKVYYRQEKIIRTHVHKSSF